MEAIYRLTEREANEQFEIIAKYTGLIYKEKSYKDLANLDNIKVYEETIEKAKQLVEVGLVIDNEFRINLMLKSGKKLEICE